MKNVDAPIARYDRLAARYDKRWRRYNQVVGDEVLRVLPDNLNGARVLDVGAGTGVFLERLLQKHSQLHEIAALEPSLAMLQQARDKLQKLQLSHNESSTRLSFMDGNAEDLPFANASFDVVLSMNVLHYLVRPEKFFAEAHRVLDVGGQLIVQDYTRNKMPGFATAMRFFDKGMRQLYTPRQLNVLAEVAGFRVLRARDFRISWFWRGILLCAKKE